MGGKTKRERGGGGKIAFDFRYSYASYLPPAEGRKRGAEQGLKIGATVVIESDGLGRNKSKWDFKFRFLFQHLEQRNQ